MFSINDIQQIAQGVVDCSDCCDGQLFTGKVTGKNPLKIQLGVESGSIVIDGDDIILTQSVVAKKLHIKKHTHKIGQDIAGHTHTSTLTVTGSSAMGGPVTGTATGTTDPTQSFNAETKIVDVTIEAFCSEYGHNLPYEYDETSDETVVTINRALEVGDYVIMTRVSGGQQFIVLSRAFEVDKPGEDDGGDYEKDGDEV